RRLFSFNHMGTWTKIKELHITLPVTKSGDIDYAYMESFICEMGESRIREMDAYLKVSGFESCELTEEELKALQQYHNRRNKKVVIGTLFDIKKGKRLTKDDMISGKINFVDSTASNNGITALISNESHIHQGNNHIILLLPTMVLLVRRFIKQIHFGLRMM
ncbi:MAG: hypothetical protein ACI3ZY_10385, partial [Parabacteroides sp.]